MRKTIGGAWVTLQPGIQTRFEKNERMFKLKNPVANEQQKHQQLFYVKDVKGRYIEMNQQVREYLGMYAVFSPRKDVQQLIGGYGESITGTLRVTYKDSYIVAKFISDNTELICRVATETDDIYMDADQIIVTEDYGDWIFRYMTE